MRRLTSCLLTSLGICCLASVALSEESKNGKQNVVSATVNRATLSKRGRIYKCVNFMNSTSHVVTGYTIDHGPLVPLPKPIGNTGGGLEPLLIVACGPQKRVIELYLYVGDSDAEARSNVFVVAFPCNEDPKVLELE